MLSSDRVAAKPAPVEVDLALLAPRNIHLKVMALLFMILSGVLCATGRGFFGLVHGVSGSVLGIECFFVVSRYDSRGTLRLLKLLMLYILLSLLIGTYALSTITEFCEPANATNDYALCLGTTYFFAILYLLGGGAGTFLFWLIILAFWRAAVAFDKVRDEAEDKWRLR